MKKILILLLSTICSVSILGCNSSENIHNENNNIKTIPTISNYNLFESNEDLFPINICCYKNNKIETLCKIYLPSDYYLTGKIITNENQLSNNYFANEAYENNLKFNCFYAVSGYSLYSNKDANLNSKEKSKSDIKSNDSQNNIDKLNQFNSIMVSVINSSELKYLNKYSFDNITISNHEAYTCKEEDAACSVIIPITSDDYIKISVNGPDYEKIDTLILCELLTEIIEFQ